jgi:hypothetical protein
LPFSFEHLYLNSLLKSKLVIGISLSVFFACAQRIAV